jgi:hypothetical protein
MSLVHCNALTKQGFVKFPREHKNYSVANLTQSESKGAKINHGLFLFFFSLSLAISYFSLSIRAQILLVGSCVEQ